MKTSVIVRTRDEAPRLRLALASFEQQAGLDEIVVTDDGSTDDTAAVLAQAAARLPLRIVRHETAQGRAAASNSAADAATGDLLIFFDGDTLCGPGTVAAHRGAHEHPDRIARGETWHLRCTRFLSDPEAATPQPGESSRLARMTDRERDKLRVTRAQVIEAFPTIHRRASPGIYPGTGPRRLHDLEMQALRTLPDSDMLWAAASGSNISIRRDAFIRHGGFAPAIDINEHRELAYRLGRAGIRMVPAEGARSYHLTHRSGWRDPLNDDRWERGFRAAHPEAPLDRLKAYWAAVGQEAVGMEAAGADFFV